LVEPCSVLLEVHYTDLYPYKQLSDLFSVDVQSHPQIRAEADKSPSVSRGGVPPSGSVRYFLLPHQVFLSKE